MCLPLIHEHSGAALQYGINKDFSNGSRHVVFYDMGSSSTYAALVYFSAYNAKEYGKTVTVNQFQAIIHSGQISLAISQSDHLSLWPSLIPVISPCSQSQGRKRFPVGRIVVRKHSPPANFSGDDFFLHRKDRLEEISNFSQSTGARKPSTRWPRAFSGWRLHLTRWRVRPCTCLFGVLLPRGPFDQFFRLPPAIFSQLPIPARALGSVLLPFRSMTKYGMASSQVSSVTSPESGGRSEIPNLGGSDSSPILITGHKLNGHNYLQWSQSVLLFICGKGKDEYLTGEAAMPETTEPGFRKWKIENSMIMSWLINSMNNDIGEIFLLFRTAKDIWDAAKETYSSSENTSELFQVESALHDFRQGEQSVTQYYNTLTRYWQQLDLFETHSWKCSDDAATYRKIVEQKRLFKFFLGLNRELDDVRGRIMGIKPLPSLREAFSDVRREESRKKVMMGSKEQPAPTLDASALAARSFNSSDGDRQKRDRPWCDYCKKPGHYKEACWKLHGKPTDWKPKPRSDRDGRAHVAANSESTSVLEPSPFNKEQMEMLQKLLSQVGSGSTTGIAFTANRGGMKPWIVDTGASDHMTGDAAILQNYKPSNGHSSVHIADGSKSKIAGTGSIKLTKDLYLDSVLHVPNLDCNLLSISKLARDLQCVTKFYPNSCVFQDLKSGKMIGSAELCSGLYLLSCGQFSNQVSQASCVQSQSMLESFNSVSNSKGESMNEHQVWESLLEGYLLVTQSHQILLNSRPLSCPHPCHHQSSQPSTQCSFSRDHPVSHAYSTIAPQLANENLQVYIRRRKRQELEHGSQSTCGQYIDSNSSLPEENIGEDRAGEVLIPSIDDSTLPIALRKGVRRCTDHSIGNYVMYEGLSPSYRAFATSLDDTQVPNTIQEALKISEWKKAVQDEIDALEKNGTWTITDLPVGKRPVGCKWIFTIKYKADGSVERFKARLVARGFTQSYGIDYQETFAPVAKLNTIKILLSLAVNQDWCLQQLDIKNAFLNGDLEEEVYMEIPPGFEESMAKNQLGYKQGQADHTLFVKKSHVGKMVILIVYVDDIILSGNDMEELQKLKKYLSEEFEVKDLGNLKYSLPEETWYRERKYTGRQGEILAACRALDLSLTHSARYWLCSECWKGLFFRKTENRDTKGNLVTWRSKKQSVVARSSAEAEYRALAQGICEGIWIKRVLSELGQTSSSPILMMCDNQAAISIAKNPVHHDRTKHVEIDRHFITEKVKDVSWDPELGGQNMEMRLVEYFADEFNQQVGNGVDVRKFPKAMAKLKKQVKRTKEILKICFFSARSAITCEKFEELCEDLWERSLILVKEVLKNSGLKVDEIYAVELIGGATRVPSCRFAFPSSSFTYCHFLLLCQGFCVPPILCLRTCYWKIIYILNSKAKLQEFLGRKDLDRHLDADEAIVLGAALHAANLNESTRQLIVPRMKKTPQSSPPGVSLLDLLQYAVSGLADASAKYSSRNLSSPIKANLHFSLSRSGILSLDRADAVTEITEWIEVPKLESSEELEKISTTQC
ncbi:Heat shock 70 kDa protein 17 [Vitis vinifera]|uniref:Heat shock 70 kDa protein 17 n=1 Tax=Vitis vinifera TaxID=29760 RepID=A0A438JQP7_VITVI|nr:Heat shock 70 kDa protein 17 [Vitis vinifera]